jgi:zinc protease
MKPNPAILFALVFALAISALAQKSEPVKPAKLPTVAEILDKYVKALGGRDAIQKVKTRVAIGTVELAPMNLKGIFESYAAPEAKSYTKITIAGIGDLLEGTDGKTAWSTNPIQGSRDRAGTELSQAKLLNDFYRDIRLEKLFAKMELKGIERVGERDAYVVIATAEGVSPETWYFDTQTGLLIRSDVTAVTPEGSQPMTVYYEDHRTVDGIQIPFRIRTQTPNFQIIMNSTEVRHGTPIDDSKFAKPKQ